MSDSNVLASLHQHLLSAALSIPEQALTQTVQLSGYVNVTFAANTVPTTVLTPLGSLPGFKDAFVNYASATVDAIQVHAPRHPDTDLYIAFAIREQYWCGTDSAPVVRTYNNVRNTPGSAAVYWNSKVTSAATESVTVAWPPFAINRSPYPSFGPVHGPALAIGFHSNSPTAPTVASGTYRFEIDLRCTVTGRGSWTA